MPALAVTLWGVFTYWKFRIPHGIDFARLEVVSLEGKRIRFSELATKSNTPVIVIFGQSWCHDCHSDMLSLHTARARFYPRSRVLILSDEYSSTVRAWQKEMHLPFEYFQLTQPLDELGVFAYPTTYVLGENLRVVYSKVGSVEWQSQEIRRLFP